MPGKFIERMFLLLETTCTWEEQTSGSFNLVSMVGTVIVARSDKPQTNFPTTAAALSNYILLMNKECRKYE